MPSPENAEGNIGKDSHGYLTFGGDINSEQRFGDLVIPSHLTVEWPYGTENSKPFLEAQTQAMQPAESGT